VYQTCHASELWEARRDSEYLIVVTHQRGVGVAKLLTQDELYRLWLQWGAEKLRGAGTDLVEACAAIAHAHAERKQACQGRHGIAAADAARRLPLSLGRWVLLCTAVARSMLTIPKPATGCPALQRPRIAAAPTDRAAAVRLAQQLPAAAWLAHERSAGKRKVTQKAPPRLGCSSDS
jgi:hypothetical protein